MNVNSYRQSAFDLFIVRAIYLFDSFSMALVAPIFARLIIKSGFGFEVHATTDRIRPIFLGIAIMSFPLSQYAGILLLLKIRLYERLKALKVTTSFLLMIGFALSSLAIYVNSFLLLVFSRMITGLGASNYIIGHSVADDWKAEEKKRTALNLFSLTLIGLILGISVGGLLSDHSISRYFSPQMPFLFGLVASTFLALITLFSKFHLNPNCIQSVCQALYPGYALSHIQKTGISAYVAIFFLALLSWFAILQFFSAFLVIEYDASTAATTLSLIIMSLAFLFSFFAIYPVFERFFPSSKLLCQFSLAGASLFLLLLGFTTTAWLSASFHSIFAAYTAIIWRETSKQIDKKKETKDSSLTGIKQFTLLSAASITPVIASPLCVISVWWIYHFALAANVLALLITLQWKRTNSLKHK